jgi:hypothetical protein
VKQWYPAEETVPPPAHARISHSSRPTASFYVKEEPPALARPPLAHPDPATKGPFQRRYTPSRGLRSATPLRSAHGPRIPPRVAQGQLGPPRKRHVVDDYPQEVGGNTDVVSGFSPPRPGDPSRRAESVASRAGYECAGTADDAESAHLFLYAGFSSGSGMTTQGLWVLRPLEIALHVGLICWKSVAPNSHAIGFDRTFRARQLGLTLHPLVLLGVYLMGWSGNIFSICWMSGC